MGDRRRIDPSPASATPPAIERLFDGAVDPDAGSEPTGDQSALQVDRKRGVARSRELAEQGENHRAHD
jgi:hypothetical protein